MTKIEWVRSPDGTQGKTWNVTLGCSKVSPGCDGCYAISVAHRAMTPAHKGLTFLSNHGPDWTGEVRCLPERLDIPLKRRKPTTWFVDSMSDLFHPEIDYGFITRVFGVMAASPRHTYQVLTKRPPRMASIVGDTEGAAGFERMVRGEMEHSITGPELPSTVWAGWPLPNVWLGTSIESDRYTFRADHLRATPAAVRWLSLEPLLSPLPSLSLEGIDWIVVGGESGPKARPMHPDWVRDIRDRCVQAGIPFLLKQWGEWLPESQRPASPPPVSAWQSRRWVDSAGNDRYTTGGAAVRRVGKKAAGRELDGQVWDQMPKEVGRG